MTISVKELLAGSRDVQLGYSPRAVLRYVIRGTESESEALSALLAESPYLCNEIPRLTWQVSAVTDEMWYGEVRYGYVSKHGTGAKIYQFDTGGGTQHITQSIATVARYARPGYTPPNFQGAIGVSRNNIEGVDIAVPVYNFGLVNYESNAAVSEAYKQVLYNLTGKVNQASWNGYNAGEVLFLGASGSMRKGGDWEITYRFAASPNKTNLTIGNISGITKKGWEYLWVQYIDEEDASAGSMIKRPHSVHIEQVYEYGNFSQLHV